MRSLESLRILIPEWDLLPARWGSTRSSGRRRRSRPVGLIVAAPPADREMNQLAPTTSPTQRRTSRRPSETCCFKADRLAVEVVGRRGPCCGRRRWRRSCPRPGRSAPGGCGRPAGPWDGPWPAALPVAGPARTPRRSAPGQSDQQRRQAPAAVRRSAGGSATVGSRIAPYGQASSHSRHWMHSSGGILHVPLRHLETSPRIAP